MRPQDSVMLTDVDYSYGELPGFLQEPGSGHRWVRIGQHQIWRPPTDVYETDTHVIVKVEIAGMDEEQFSISLNGKSLVIGGVRHDPAAKLAYQQMEIPYGQFETHVHLPWAIEEDQVEASYHNGFLSVLLPKSHPKRIPVGRLRNSAG